MIRNEDDDTTRTVLFSSSTVSTTMENVESDDRNLVVADQNAGGLQAGRRLKSSLNANEFSSEDALETADTVSKTVRNYFPETWLYDMQLVE